MPARHTSRETSTSRTRTRALTTAPLALGMAVALAAAPAQASSTSKEDPAGDHVIGSNPTLDLAKVSMRTKARKKKIQVTFALHHDVAAEHLAFPGGLGVDFQVTKRTVRSVRVFVRRGELRSTVCSYDSRQDLPTPTKCSRLPVTQVDGKTFRATVKRNQIKKRAKVLKWRASAYEFAAAAVDPVGTGKRPYRWRP